MIMPLQHDDLKADDLGSWNQKGSEHTNFHLNDNGHMSIIAKEVSVARVIIPSYVNTMYMGHIHHFTD